MAPQLLNEFKPHEGEYLQITGKSSQISNPGPAILNAISKIEPGPKPPFEITARTMPALLSAGKAFDILVLFKNTGQSALNAEMDFEIKKSPPQIKKRIKVDFGPSQIGGIGYGENQLAQWVAKNSIFLMSDFNPDGNIREPSPNDLQWSHKYLIKPGEIFPFVLRFPHGLAADQYEIGITACTDLFRVNQSYYAYEKPQTYCRKLWLALDPKNEPNSNTAPNTGIKAVNPHLCIRPNPESGARLFTVDLFPDNAEELYIITAMPVGK